MSARTIRYKATPTGSLFHRSDALLRGIMGPIGSGKSVTCVQEVLRLAREQQPNAEGVRRSRWAIVRNTYPELEATTIKTWVDWVPEEICPIVRSRPIRGHMRVMLNDLTVLDLEVFFLALDRPKDVKKLLSLELTGVWFNEAREIPKAIIDAGLGRIGRFPSKKDGGWTRKAAIADTNPPDDSHWWYRYAEGALRPDETQPENWAFFQQPPALQLVNGEWQPHPQAENVENHTDGAKYWLDQIGGKTRQWIRVYIEGKYGTVQSGLPVYADYNDELHFVEGELAVIPGRPLLLGWDFGLTPACVVGQLTPRGRLVVLREYTSERSGLSQFIQNVVRPGLATDFPGVKIGLSIGDPAGNQGAQTDEQTCFDILRREGFTVIAAASNALERRLEGVNHFLTRLIDARPAFAIDHRSPTLRKGFNGGYRHAQIQVGGDERFHTEPLKNRFSHPHDALQYLAMHAQGGEFYHDKQVQQALGSIPARAASIAGY